MVKQSATFIIAGLQRLLAIMVIAITTYCVANYPYASIWLSLILIAYALCLLIAPSIWLLAIPTILPLLNLAPWSGRFFLEEFDFFIWVTLASSLWQGDFIASHRPRFSFTPSLLIGLFLTTHSIAMLRGLFPLAAIDANAFSSYYSQYNGLRVGKSLFWAALLIPAMLRAFSTNQVRARHYLTLGISIGLIGTGIAVLWERGVFIDLVYGDTIYQKLRNLTDFSTDYRITALFSEMHTGGEAVDGYIALTWPFALAGLVTAVSKIEMGIEAMALSAGLYSALVTFSRGTYAAIGVSLVAFAVLYAVGKTRREVSSKQSWHVPIILLATVAICSILYVKGGYYSLIAAMAIFGCTILLGFINGLRHGVRILLMALVCLGGFALMMRGLLTSKWVDNGFVESLAISLPMSVGLLASGIFIGIQTRKFFSLREVGISLTFIITVIVLCVPALSGSYMKSRFTTTHDDFGSRINHWQHAMALMDSSWDTLFFGMGLGVFPRTYLWGKESEKSSMATLNEEGGNTSLRLSNSMDLAIGQRVHLEAEQVYRLSLDYKSNASIGTLDISICRRNIIVPWDSDCISTSQAIKPGKWQHFEWELNMGQIGDGVQIGRRPLALRFTHFYYQPQGDYNLPLNFIEIDNIQLMDRYGWNHVTNGQFEHGLDNWFPTSDHSHLPLHIKNLWVNIFFEQGLFGLFAFLALTLYALIIGIRIARRGDIFAMTLVSSAMGFFSVGLIGTLYDVPRVIFLFFLLLFTLLAQDPALMNQISKRKPVNISPDELPKMRNSFIQPPANLKQIMF